nr:FimB/Mfa2 family fimbrial subunit [Parabacteroides goldsteinii]
MKSPISANRFAIHLMAMLIALCILPGCVMQDLEECPPVPPAKTGKVWFKFSFTLHNQMGEDGTYEDLFARYTQSVEIFIFDAGGRFIKKQTDTQGPFTDDYRLQTELAPGDYRAISWVNLHANPDIILLPEPQEGITTFDEMQVQLRHLAPKGTPNAATEPIPLFHGDTQTFTIRENDGYDQEIVIPSDLTRDTNRIRFAISWRDKDTQKLCPRWMHADSTRIYIDDNYGAIGFDNLPVQTDSLNYIPAYLSGGQAGKSTSATGNSDSEGDEAATLHAQAGMLRLMTSSTPGLRICRLQPDGSEKTVYRAALMNDFISRLYKTQEALDREDLFNIELEFTCEHVSEPDDPDNPDNPDNPDVPDIPVNPDKPGKESWIAVKISINGWTLVDNGDIDL